MPSNNSPWGLFRWGLFTKVNSPMGAYPRRGLFRVAGLFEDLLYILLFLNHNLSLMPFLFSFLYQYILPYQANKNVSTQVGKNAPSAANRAFL